MLQRGLGVFLRELLAAGDLGLLILTSRAAVVRDTKRCAPLTIYYM